MASKEVLNKLLDTMDLNELKIAERVIDVYIRNKNKAQEEKLKRYPSYHFEISSENIMSLNGESEFSGLDEDREFYQNQFFIFWMQHYNAGNEDKYIATVEPAEDLDKKNKLVVIIEGSDGTTTEQNGAFYNAESISDVTVYIVPKDFR